MLYVFGNYAIILFDKLCLRLRTTTFCTYCRKIEIILGILKFHHRNKHTENYCVMRVHIQCGEIGHLTLQATTTQIQIFQNQRNREASKLAYN